MNVDEPAGRCVRCRRPHALCLCARLTPVPTRTRVVILQHPREHGVRMNTARLVALALRDAELHVGVCFDDDARMIALAREAPERVALLYPGPGATPLDELAAPPSTLVVVDGTWSTARKLVARNAVLGGLRRVALRPVAPSAYRIRREPAPHCLSTLEAIVDALVVLEGDADRFASLRAAFSDLVETQLRHAGHDPVPYHRLRKRRRARPPSPLDRLLATRFDDVVLVQAEGMPHAGGGPHELVQLAAVRPATGARFAVVIRPRRPLWPRTPERLGIAPSLLDAGTTIDDARRAWASFVRPNDRLVGWGRFTPTVLAAEDAVCPSWLDLRAEVGRRLGRKAGGAEAAATAIGAEPGTPPVPGRAGTRLAALGALVAALARDIGNLDPAEFPPVGIARTSS